MIEEERLKELIKKNEKIYIRNLSNDTNVVSIRECNALDFATLLISNLGNEVYDNKKDAEFFLKYIDILRNERLDLPTWDEFKEQEVFTFYGKDYNNYDICLWHDMRTNEPSTITIELVDNIGSTNVFKIDASEENYIEACSLARSLFLGEKDVEK